MNTFIIEAILYRRLIPRCEGRSKWKCDGSVKCIQDDGVRIKLDVRKMFFSVIRQQRNYFLKAGATHQSTADGHNRRGHTKNVYETLSRPKGTLGLKNG